MTIIRRTTLTCLSQVQQANQKFPQWQLRNMHADVYWTTDTNVDNVMKEKEQALERSNDSEKHVSGEGRWDFPTMEVCKLAKSGDMDSNC